MVASAQKNLLEERLKLVTELWNAGIKVGVCVCVCESVSVLYVQIKSRLFVTYTVIHSPMCSEICLCLVPESS